MGNRNLIWIVDDDRSIRWVLEKAMVQAGLTSKSFETGDALNRQLQVEQPDVIISDIRMPGTNGLELLARINKQFPDIPVIITTAHSDLDSAVASYQGGAFEYLPKPFDTDEVVAVTRRALTHTQKKKSGAAELKSEAPPDIVGAAPAMQEVFRAIGRLSHSNITVLINGESGTGKELVARALHRHSPKASGPFIALNMAAIPKDLIESELFGHEKGAFTGANHLRQGRFEQANGGTLFLDEIGDMPAEAQTRLLRVLADGEFYRVGGHTSLKVDVRIIAATHQNLEQAVKNNLFREDLYHRLNVIRIHLPRLAERKEDIPQLAKHFFQLAAKEMGEEPKLLLPETADYLSRLPWPGNVRQLENVCRWLTVMAPGREIHQQDLPPELLKQEFAGHNHDGETSWVDSLKIWAAQELQTGREKILSSALPRFERTLIECALTHTNGHKREAAELLGWGRNTLTRKLKELGMDSGD